MIWVRFDKASRKVLHLSVPPFTVPAGPNEEDVQIENQPYPEHKDFLYLNAARDGFDAILSPQEIVHRQKATKRAAEIRKDPKNLSVADRISRLEIIAGLDDASP